MTMHLVGPWLSTTGKKKGKRKFRTAAGAAQARELRESWKNLLSEHGVSTEQRRKQRALTAKPLNREPLNYRGADQPRIPSLPFSGAVCARPEDKVYTGDKIKGIGVMHKSNAVPIFTDEEARDIARMRR